MSFVDECLKKYSDQPAYVNMGKSLSYKEIDTLSRNFAAYLQHLGLKKGDRIAIQLPNLLQYPVVLFGAIRAGLIIVNTNPLYTSREMEHQFKDSGAKAIVILANFAHNLEKILHQTEIKHVVITEIGDLLGGLKSKLVNFVIKRVKKMVPSYSISGAVRFNQALAIGARHPYNKPTLSLDDVGFLQYTGGTTGVSKGATLTHGNLVANLTQISDYIGNKLRYNQEVVITALPLYHIFAFTVNCLTLLKYGAKNVLITNPRDMPGFLKELDKSGFTVLSGVNTLFNGLLNQPEFKNINFSNVNLVVGGGMAVQQAVNDRWRSLTGVPILEGYGLSETSPVLTFNPTDGNDRIGTIGMPVPSTEIAIMDDDGKELPLGEAGEICARGPQVMRGYWNRDDETAKVFHPGGWFRTGDIGVMDEDGFFKIVDRKKDMILVSGFNVYPNEIEDVVVRLEGVLEAAAIGVPDDKSTEAVKLFVVKKDPNLTVDQVLAYCRENLTGYKIPKYVVFREELPKSNVGKIIRRELREETVKVPS
jgi:long-chain acyl-CoA synthetase